MAAWNRATCPGLCSGGPEGFTVPRAGRVFLALMTLETAFMIAVSGTLFAIHDATLPTGQIYAALGIFCTLAQLYFAFDAIFSENQFQFIACYLTSGLFTFFVVWQVFHNPTTLGAAWEAARYYVMAVTLAFQVAFVVAAKPVWASFGYYKWKMAGANVEIGAMYARYRVYLSLIKYDLFASVVLFLLVKVYLIDVTDPDFYIGIVSLVTSVAFMVVGWFAVTHERRALVALFYATAVLQPAYVMYKSWSLYDDPSLIPTNVTVPQFIVLGSLTILLRVAVVVAGCRCSYDFGKGLRELVFEGKRAAARVPRRRAGSASEVFLAGAGGGASLNSELSRGTYGGVREETVAVGVPEAALVQPAAY